MAVREFVFNGERVDLNYSPDLYRLAAEIAGQSVAPRSIIAIARANKKFFPRMRLELVREDLKTLRFVPVASEIVLNVDTLWTTIRVFFKCPKCGKFVRTKEEAIGCPCSKTKNEVLKRK